MAPHVLRHSPAMELLQAGVDIAVIALWLGHESIRTTQVYLRAHLALKEAAVTKVKPFDGQKRRAIPAQGQPARFPGGVMTRYRP